MGILVRTLISSSAGNCLRISSGASTLLVDCGFRSQRDCYAALDQVRGEVAVLVSHSHGDHLNYSGLKALARRGVEIHTHQRVLQQLAYKVAFNGWSDRPRFDPFDDDPFTMLDFRITPLEVRHAPGVPNFAFIIECAGGTRRRKIVVATDLCDYRDVAGALVDADLIYIESNHDLDLLRQHPNPASHYHLSNPKTASLLAAALPGRFHTPQAIMLGHLSDERNREELAIDTVQSALDRAGLKVPLSAAPLYAPSHELVID